MNDKIYLVLENKNDIYKIESAIEEHLNWWKKNHEDHADDEFIYNIESEWIEALKRILKTIKSARNTPF